VRLQAPGGRLFSDISEAALGANRCWREDGLPGLGPFLGQISRLEGMSRYGHHGLAMGDVNGDGLDDVYAPNAGGLPNHLFLQNPDGTFTDQAAAWQVDFLENCSGALLVDLDNDGWSDLVVAGVARVLVLRNNGRGQFELRGSFGGVSDPMSLSATDYDRDGQLDLYICGYMATPGSTRIFSPVPYHDANNGGRNALLRNEGGFRFRDVTVETGLDEHNRRFSFAAAWDDFDGDGWPDLYVANDFGRNNLFHNRRGTFNDVADTTGTEDTGAGMSACWGDVNRDGRPDLYVGNMFSSAGQRVAYQPEFATRQAPDATRAMQRMARGNSLLINTPRPGQPAFTDVSETAGITLGRWAWASRVADLNNDGWPDLLVANGYISGEDPHDL